MKTFTICYKVDGKIIPFVQKETGQLYCYNNYVKATRPIKGIVEYFENCLKGTPRATGFFGPIAYTPPSEYQSTLWKTMIETIFIKEDEI